VQAVAARPTGVEQRPIHVRLDRLAMLAKRERRSCDLLGGLTLHAKRNHEGGDLGPRGLPLEYHIHRGLDLVRRQVTTRNQSLDHSSDHDSPLAATEDSQLRMSSWPCSVRKDSGWNCTPSIGSST